jgi:hypothetical protein
MPTTSTHSGTDEIIQPQFEKWVSALMHDELQAGVMNCEVQAVICKKPAGLMNTLFTVMTPTSSKGILFLESAA